MKMLEVRSKDGFLVIRTKYLNDEELKARMDYYVSIGYKVEAIS
jgi:hypothetical protein